MALRDFSNANTARVQAFVADGGLNTVNTIVTANRVVVLGMFDNDTKIPVQTLYPATAGSVTIQDMLPSTYNKVVVGSVTVLTPSEVSIALEELMNAGVQVAQVIRVASDNRYRDVTARQVRQRYIAYENAYELLADVPVDFVYPCNVVSGLKGDGMYNNNTLGTTHAANDTSVAVVYDPDLFAAATPDSAALLIADMDGFVAGSAADYTKGDGVALNAPEDLVYQLADACKTFSTQGTFCTGVFRTLNAVELKSLTTIQVGSTAGKATNWGGDATGVAGLAPNSAIWAMIKTDATHSVIDDYVFTAAHGADKLMTNQDALTAYEAVSRFADTNGLKAPVKLAAEPVFNDGTAPGSVAVPYMDVILWRLAFGTPTRSEMRKWENYIRDFGNTYGSGIASMIELDGVNDADGDGVADHYKLWQTNSHEKPVGGELDADVVKDFNGKPVDLGIFLDGVAANSILPLGKNTALISTTTPKKFTFGAGLGQLVGWYYTTASSESTTRKVTANLEPLGFLGGRAVSDFTRRRFQTFFVEDAQYKLARDITMGKFVSDTLRTNFINRFTTRIVKDALDLACTEGRKYLGKGDTVEARAALKQKLEQEYTRWANPEDGRLKKPAGVTVLSTGTDAVVSKLLTQLKLAIPGEILEVTVQAALEQ